MYAQEFFEIRNEFYKEAQGIVLVFDVSSRDTFDDLDSWISEATKFGVSINDIPVVLCANKIDKRRMVSEDEGRQYASTKGIRYFETSAMSGANVSEMFQDLFGLAVRKAKVMA